jgi:large subunit ribosomal protein L4
MLSMPITDLNKKAIGDLEVPEEIVKAEIRPDLLQLVVRWQLACRRAGTVATKTKGLVRGGGKKPFKQKGTGNARQGSSRSPLMPGGGTAFGPQPRDYSYTLPQKVKQAGLKVALSYLVSEGRLWVVDSLKSDGKTGSLVKSLKSFGVEKAVVVDEAGNALLKRAARNLTNYKFLAVGGVNVFDLLKYDACVLTKNAMAQLMERLGENNVNH